MKEIRVHIEISDVFSVFVTRHCEVDFSEQGLVYQTQNLDGS